MDTLSRGATMTMNQSLSYSSSCISEFFDAKEYATDDQESSTDDETGASDTESTSDDEQVLTVLLSLTT